VPSAIDGLAGVTAIDTSTAGVTVNVVEPLMPAPASVAVIVVVPLATLVARPLLPPALLTVAVVSVPELHVTAAVRFCVVLSLKVPVAMNCCVVPRAIDGFVGVTAIDSSTAGVTVNVAEPSMPVSVSVAVIVVVPGAKLVARPLLPALLTAAVADISEFHVTAAVRSRVVLSL
jgi:hypothetical protein